MIYLKRHEPHNNVHRFYTLQISRDLFGLWVLVRTWGRVGSRGGQSLVMSFENESEAVMVLERLGTQKKKRGYGRVKKNDVIQ